MSRDSTAIILHRQVNAATHKRSHNGDRFGFEQFAPNLIMISIRGPVMRNLINLIPFNWYTSVYDCKPAGRTESANLLQAARVRWRRQQKSPRMRDCLLFAVGAVTNWRKKGCPFDKGQWQVLDWMFMRPYLPRRAKEKFSCQFQRRFRSACVDLRATFVLLGLPIPDHLQRI